MPEERVIINQVSWRDGEVSRESRRISQRSRDGLVESAYRLENMIPLVTGGLKRRPGTELVSLHDIPTYGGNIRFNGGLSDVKLIPFEINNNESYLIELFFRTENNTDYLQVRSIFARIGEYSVDFDDEVRVAIDIEEIFGFGTGNIEDIRYARLGDLLYLFHDNIPPIKLIHTGGGMFKIEKETFKHYSFKKDSNRLDRLGVLFGNVLSRDENLGYILELGVQFTDTVSTTINRAYNNSLSKQRFNIQTITYDTGVTGGIELEVDFSDSLDNSETDSEYLFGVDNETAYDALTDAQKKTDTLNNIKSLNRLINNFKDNLRYRSFYFVENDTDNSSYREVRIDADNLFSLQLKIDTGYPEEEDDNSYLEGAVNSWGVYNSFRRRNFNVSIDQAGFALPDDNVLVILMGSDLPLRFNYPSVGTFHQNRLVLGSSAVNPRTLWFSNIGLFDHLESHLVLDPTTEVETAQDDGGFPFTIGGENLAQINWLYSFDNQLFLGTYSGEWRIASSGNLTPFNGQSERIGRQGTIFVNPLRIQDEIIFVKSNGHQLFSQYFSEAKNNYISQDLSLMSNRIYEGGGIKKIVYQDGKTPLIWILLKNNGLLTFSYRVSEGFVLQGYARHRLQQEVYDIEVIENDVYLYTRTNLGIQNILERIPNLDDVDTGTQSLFGTFVSRSRDIQRLRSLRLEVASFVTGILADGKVSFTLPVNYSTQLLKVIDKENLSELNFIANGGNIIADTTTGNNELIIGLRNSAVVWLTPIGFSRYGDWLGSDLRIRNLRVDFNETRPGWNVKAILEDFQYVSNFWTLSDRENQTVALKEQVIDSLGGVYGAQPRTFTGWHEVNFYSLQSKDPIIEIGTEQIGPFNISAVSYDMIINRPIELGAT